MLDSVTRYTIKRTLNAFIILISINVAYAVTVCILYMTACTVI